MANNVLYLSILAIDPPERLRTDLSYDTATASQLSEVRSGTDVVLCTTKAATQLKPWLTQQCYTNPTCQIVLIETEPIAPQALLQLINQFPTVNIFESWADPRLEFHLFKCLEKSRQMRLDRDLAIAVKDQNNQLKQLMEKLESSVKLRQSELLEARKKNFVALARWTSMRKAAIAIHESQSFDEMERMLREALGESMEIQGLKIHFDGVSSTLPSPVSLPQFHSVHKINLKKPGEDQNIGHVIFLKAKDRPFSRDETDFLSKITEIISLAVDRLGQLLQSKNLRLIWESTFNAMTEPVVLLDDHYNIVQTNSAFEKKRLRAQGKCYQVLFDRETPCPHCKLGQSFQFEIGKTEKRTFDVSSHPVELMASTTPYFVNQYNDISETIKLERKILESSKLAELGTIGGSIAHELNNPLGGILSFVQLIKMNLDSTHPAWDDIIEMEKGVQRCRDIVLNLLSLAHEPGADKASVFDLREQLQSTVALLELTHRNAMLEIKFKTSPLPVKIKAVEQQVAQALQMLANEIISSLSERKKANPQFIGLLDISLTESKNEITVSFLDNCPGTDLPSGLGTEVARKILHENRATLELSFPSKNLRMAKIAFQRLDFADTSPEAEPKF